MNTYYVYILGNNRPTFYVGVTDNLIRRIYEHKQGSIRGFTTKYNVKKLLYFDVFDDIGSAILREKQLKHWNRQWKIDLIRTNNPDFNDLYYLLT